MDAIFSFLVQIYLYIFVASIRPFKYLLSSEYRQKIKLEWVDTPRFLFYAYIFYGLILLVLLILYLLYNFYYKEEETTKLEQLKHFFELL